MNMNTNILTLASSNINTNINNNYKSDVITDKTNNTFNNILSKTASVNQDSDTSNRNDKSQDLKDSKFEVSEETKSALKKAGLSDKEIENIKSPDDLKNVITEKILSKDSNSKIDSDKLLMLLASLLKVDVNDLKSIKANTMSEIKDAVDSAIKAIGNEGKNLTGDKLSQILSSFGDKFKEILDKNFSKVQDPTMKLILTKEVISQVQKQIIPQITENLTKANIPTASQDVISKLQQELKLALNNLNSQKDSNKNREINTSDFKEVYKEVLNDKNAYQTSVTSKQQNQNAGENSSSKKETSKEDNFLKSLASDGNNGDKISKASNFMTQFNNNVNKNIKVEDVTDMVINKNNMTNDVIKTIKYMETNNIKNLTVKIAPKELGEVIIKLTVDGGVMKASIGASNKEAFNILNSNISDMTQKLQNNDTKINSLSLNIYNEDTTFFKDGSNNGNNQNSKNNKKSKDIGAIEEITDEIEDEMENNLNILA